MRFGLVVEYDGTDFHGSQLQSNARTVQGEIEHALFNIFHRSIRIYFASRTDSGVHARGQVGRFNHETDMPADKIRIALNHYMKDDVRIRYAEVVKDGYDGFDPRGDASSRTYVYTFNDAQSAPALNRRYVAHVRKKLNVETMNVACRSLIGSHDFAAFAGPGTPIDASTRRQVKSAVTTRDGDNIKFKITANAYLHQQIRRVAGVLYDVGCGNAPHEVICKLLDSARRGGATQVMPASGLCLESIAYDGSGLFGLPVIPTSDSFDVSVN